MTAAGVLGNQAFQMRGQYFSRSTGTIPRRKRLGFTLMETLVAIMIMAISLAVILQVFSSGLHAGRLSHDYTRAVFLAREKMEQVLLVKDLQTGRLSGLTADGYRWTADVAAVQNEAGDEQMPVQRFGIRLEVQWLDGVKEKNFLLTTMTLLPKPWQVN